MSIYDRVSAERRKKSKEEYEKLKSFICSKEEDNSLSEFFLAYEHLRDMEIKLEQQEKELKEFKDFFKVMSKFLPKKSATVYGN